MCIVCEATQDMANGLSGSTALGARLVAVLAAAMHEPYAAGITAQDPEAIMKKGRETAAKMFVELMGCDEQDIVAATMIALRIGTLMESVIKALEGAAAVRKMNLREAIAKASEHDGHGDGSAVVEAAERAGFAVTTNADGTKEIVRPDVAALADVPGEHHSGTIEMDLDGNIVAHSGDLPIDMVKALAKAVYDNEKDKLPRKPDAPTPPAPEDIEAKANKMLRSALGKRGAPKPPLS